jgi:hypothetical protein
MIFGPDLVQEAEATISRIKDNLKAAKSHQENYANKSVGVFLHWQEQDGQDRVFQFRGGLTNYKAHYDLS